MKFAVFMESALALASFGKEEGRVHPDVA